MAIGGDAEGARTVPREVVPKFLLALIFAPCLLALNRPPSPTLLNQCLALGLWGSSFAALALRPIAGSWRDLWPLFGALALLLVAIFVAPAAGAQPAGIAIANGSFVLAVALAAMQGDICAARDEGTRATSTLLLGLVVVGAVSALIAVVQVFAPDWPDGDWIARSGLPGRGVGNLRQPNHLASLLLWAAIGSIALVELRRLTPFAGAALLVLLPFGVVISGSRTGLLGTLLLAAWAIVDRHLSRPSRILLLASPVIAGLCWLALAAWSHGTGHAFGGEARLLAASGGDISSSRFGIWHNTLTMLSREPWTGVGFGEFNLAWTLTELPQRPIAFFDHTHNLPLQLLVELGLPLGTVVCALLLWSAWLAVRRSWQVDGDAGIARRAAAMMVLMVGLHSQLEYPLWYAYLLLPTAFFWGFALADPRAPGPRAQPAGRSWAVRGLGLALILGAAAAVLDYHQVVVIYEPPEDAAPLEDRIARGQRSLLFGHHADYAAATAFGEPKAPLSPSQKLAFERAPHHLLDIRLMIAWAQALAAEGKVDQARWLSARIREFRNPGSDEFFAPCGDATQATQAFQCQKPERAWHWREFVNR